MNDRQTDKRQTSDRRQTRTLWGGGIISMCLTKQYNLVLTESTGLVVRVRDPFDRNKLCGRPPQYAPVPCNLIFDLLTLKVVSRVTCDVGYLCANFSLPMDLCSRLRPMYTTDRRQTSDAHHRLMPPTLGAGHNKNIVQEQIARDQQVSKQIMVWDWFSGRRSTDLPCTIADEFM